MTDKELKRKLIKKDGQYHIRYFYEHPYQCPDWMKSTKNFEPYLEKIMNVKLIRMWSGEDVMADLVEDKEDSIVLSNAIVAVPVGNGQLTFAPWSPLLKKGTELEIPKTYVVYISEPQDETAEGYVSMFSTIQTPSKSLIL